MAPKQKKNSPDLAAIFNSLPSNSGGVAPAPVQQAPLDPQTLPTVPRPDVPDTVQQAPAAATDDSLLGKFTQVMDNVVPDDLGGMVRGSSGWLANVPGYQQTVGAVAGAALSGGESVMNALTWGTDQMNHLGAALASFAPGGIQTLDWDQSQQVSFGQVMQANAGIAAQQAKSGNLGDALLSLTGTGIVPLISIAADPMQPVVTEDNFDILDPAFQQRAFKDNTAAMLSSGFADAVWSVAADPTIVGGKVTSVLRFGTKAGDFAGLTNRALKTTEAIGRFSDDVTEQGRIIAQYGIDEARAQGLITAEGENLIAALQGNADQLVNHAWVKGSPQQQLAARRLLGRTSVDDAETAAHLVGAMAGNMASWSALLERDISLYDDLAQTVGKVDPLNAETMASVADNLPASVAGTAPAVVDRFPVLTPQQMQYGDNLIDDAINEAVVRDPDADWGKILDRGGMTFNATGVRLANAWRRGAAANQFANNPLTKAAVPAAMQVPVSDRAQWMAVALERTAASRPITVVRWLGQGTPTGIVHLKGGDGTYSLNEISAFLRKSPLDQASSARLLNDYASQTTVQGRMQAAYRIEEEAVAAIASQRGLTPTQAMLVYKSYSQSRHRALAQIRTSRNRFAVDPITGESISVPQFYSQLEEALPMLDLRAFSRVIDQNHSWLKTVEDSEVILDKMNSYWKLAVLLRLGYTQRNVVEGALRSFAVLGVMAANPAAWAALPANTIAYAGARRAFRKSVQAEKHLDHALKNLSDARIIYSEALQKSGWTEMGTLRKKIAQMERKATKLESLPKLTARQAEDLQKLKKRIRASEREFTKIKTNKYDPAEAGLQSMLADADMQMKQIDDLSRRVMDLKARYVAKNAKRKRGGYSSNVMEDGTELDGAFQGLDGELAAMLSSADYTAYQTFDAAVQRRLQVLASQNRWKTLDPTQLDAKGMRGYWDEYTNRLNREFRTDPVVRMIMANSPIDDIKAWLRGPGTQYRKDLSIPGRRLDSEDAVDAWLSGVIAQVDAEIPAASGMRKILLERDISRAEIKASMATRDLPKLVGREVDSSTTNLFGKAQVGIELSTTALMRWLGAIPETKLLRHPFYNAVYKERQASLWRTASEQGVDMSSPAVKQRINKAAHGAALDATRSTLYTIERWSNAAEKLRFISPFFPAFENSIRTWGGIVYRNPAVLGYGNLLWNVPNNLGWVVDANGNRVEKSNMFKDENTYIVWPQAVADLLKKDFGPFTPGEAVKSRQSGLNVVFPGGEWWWPGVGPITQIPTALLLRGRPEEADVLRAAFGGTKENPNPLFQSLLPGGNANIDLVQSLMPTWMRRLDQMRNGESADSAYLTSQNAIIEDTYIQAQIDGRTLTPADIKRAQERADKFWRWQVTAAVTLPFQSTYQSPFQLQRDAWQRLVDDQSLPYEAKVKQFTDMYGTDFLAITRSGSLNETGLQPNVRTWQRITKNPDLVRELGNMDPELVGMFGNMGAYDDPFSYAVYSEYGNYSVNADGTPVRRKLTAEELTRNNQIKDGWRAWHEVKDYAEQKAIEKGYSSLQVKDAEWLRTILDNAKAEISVKYPAWADERDKYAKKLPQFIRGARKIVENARLVQEDSTISALAEYLKIRDYAAQTMYGMRDSDAKDQIKQAAYQSANALRMADIGFADLYDQYFANDDFTVVD